MKNKAEELLIKLAMVNAEIKASKEKSSQLGLCEYYNLKHVGDDRDVKPVNQSCIDTAVFIKTITMQAMTFTGISLISTRRLTTWILFHAKYAESTLTLKLPESH